MKVVHLLWPGGLATTILIGGPGQEPTGAGGFRSEVGR